MRVTSKAGSKNKNQLTEEEQAAEEKAAGIPMAADNAPAVEEKQPIEAESLGEDHNKSIGEYIKRLEYNCRREIEEISKNTGIPLSAYLTTAKLACESKGISLTEHLVDICNRANYPPNSWRGRYDKEGGKK